MRIDTPLHNTKIAMPKPISNRAKRRKLERDLKKSGSKMQITRDNISTIKYKASKSQSDQIFSADNQGIEAFLPLNFPNSYSEIRRISYNFNYDNLEKEIVWSARLFVSNYTIITKFIDDSVEFEKEFILGNYDIAKQVLDRIEHSTGKSVWSIQNRLLIAEYQGGFAHNKDVLAKILASKNHPYTDLFARYQSLRIEKNLSYFKYSETFGNLISAFKDNEGALQYFKFRLDYFSENHYSYLGYIMNMDSNSSLIDRYSTFIDVICQAAAQGYQSLRSEDIRLSLSEVYHSTRDSRLVTILFALGMSVEFDVSEENKAYLHIIDRYVGGDYDFVVSKCEEFLPEHPLCIDLYSVYSKSAIIRGQPTRDIFPKDSIASQCLSDISIVLKKEDRATTSTGNIHKTFNSIGPNFWTYAHYFFFRQEYSWQDEGVDTFFLAHLRSRFLSALVGSNYSQLWGQRFADELNKFQAIPATTELLSDTIDDYNVVREPSFVDPLRRRFNLIRLMIRNSAYRNALTELATLQSDFKDYAAHQHIKEKIASFTLRCYENTSQWNKMLNLIVHFNIQNINAASRVFSSTLLSHVLKSNDPEILGNICLPIYLHQYQSLVSPNDIWIAYDNFLNEHGLDYPKELSVIMDKFSSEELIYFLKNICKQDVFDSSYLFENQDDLDNERIEVCSILIQIDPSNYEDYVNEISEINRYQLVRRGIKQIDESKIYVDIKGIKKSIEGDLRESFERSLRLANLSIDQLKLLDEKVDNIVVPFYDKSVDTNKVEIKEKNIKITSYSRFKHFAVMFYKIRDKFIASNEYGIDTYLSMRIRHGTLLGEIRSVFEKYNLVTKKDDSSDKYKDNEFWLNSLEIIDFEKLSEFNFFMSDFSSKIDNISNSLKNVTLQIKTERKDSMGYFDYSYGERELLNIFTNKVGAIDEFDEFFDSIIEELWEKTELNLQNIRELLSNSVRDQIKDLLARLSHNLDRLLERNDYPDIIYLLRNITECQTDVTNELNKIAEWFRRSNSRSINDFSIELPIDTTLKTITRLYKDFASLSPTISIQCPLIFEGEYFPNFNYLFQNLLHNVIQHSGLSVDELQIAVSVVSSDNNLSISVSSNFSTRTDLSRLNTIISEKTHLLSGGSFANSERIRGEDGTGYLKILKTIRVDLGIEDVDIFIHPVDESRIFSTSISFDASNLLKNVREDFISGGRST